MDSLLKELEVQLGSTTHASLVKQSQALRKMLTDVYKTSLPSIDYNDVTFDFPRLVIIFGFVSHYWKCCFWFSFYKADMNFDIYFPILYFILILI